MNAENHHGEGNPFMSNIWGWKWSLISLIIVCFFIGMAVCRYLVIKPDRLVKPEDIEQDF